MELKVPVIGILRGVDADNFGTIMKASFDAGLEALEITMNTPGAEDILVKYREHIPEGKLLGAGTIRNIEEAKLAEGAGAMFFVTPNLDTKVIEFAMSKDIPIITGALTPTEVYTGWTAGATMIKIFPCSSLGPTYIKDILGPFEDVKLVAVGGVSSGNVSEYFAAGACAVGVGSSLFWANAITDPDSSSISQNVSSFLSAIT